MTNQDERLKGNEKIETAIAALQQEPNDELLAHTLTVIRRRMKEQGQFILAVDPATAGTQINVQAVKAPDGTTWWAAFTSFDEELIGSGSVMSTFLTDIRQLFEAALKTEEIKGVILNPWNRTLMLDKSLIRIILG